RVSRTIDGPLAEHDGRSSICAVARQGRGAGGCVAGTRQRGWWLGALGVLVLATMLRAPVASLPLERDEGEYAYIAQRWMAGDVPYRDVFDQKPPGIFAFYAAAFALGGESPAAVRFAAQLWIAAGLAALAALGARLFSPAVGIAAAITGLALVSDPSWLGN